MLEKKLRYTREDIHSRSSDYAASTSSSMKDRDLNHTMNKLVQKLSYRDDTENRKPQT